MPLDTSIASLESWIEGPRWAGIKQALEKTIIGWELERHYIREDKGWLRTTVYFKISGPRWKMEYLVDALRKAVDTVV